MDEIIIPGPPESSQSPKKPVNKLIALAVLVLVLGAAKAGAFWLKTRTPQTTDIAPTPSPAVTPTPNPTPAYSNTDEPMVSGLIEWQYPSLRNFDDLTN